MILFVSYDCSLIFSCLIEWNNLSCKSNTISENLKKKKFKEFVLRKNSICLSFFSSDEEENSAERRGGEDKE